MKCIYLIQIRDGDLLLSVSSFIWSPVLYIYIFHYGEKKKQVSSAVVQNTTTFYNLVHCCKNSNVPDSSISYKKSLLWPKTHQKCLWNYILYDW